MFSWWELMVGTAKANGCFLTNTHACVTHCVCVRVHTHTCVYVCVWASSCCKEGAGAPGPRGGVCPSAGLLSAGLVLEPPRRKLQPKKGRCVCTFPAFAVRALACRASQSSPIVHYGGMASTNSTSAHAGLGSRHERGRQKILKAETVEAGDGESSPHAGHRQRQLSRENGLFLPVVQQHVWQWAC